MLYLLFVITASGGPASANGAHDVHIIPVQMPTRSFDSSGMMYATPDAGRQNMAPANIPKRMEKTAASISLLARPQKQQTKIAARKVAVIWTNMGFDHRGFPLAKKGLMRRPNTLVLSQFLSFDCYGDTDVLTHSFQTERKSRSAAPAQPTQ